MSSDALYRCTGSEVNGHEIPPAGQSPRYAKARIDPAHKEP